MTTQTLDNVLLQTDFQDLELFASGKVRDVYQLGSDHLLFVATDRISAFDYVLATGIPNKGKVLTQLSLFWFDLLRGIVPNHLVTADVNAYPKVLKPHAEKLRGRSMLVVKADMVPIECVVRDYLEQVRWNKQPPAPGLPTEVAQRTSDKYMEAYRLLTGHAMNA